MKEFFYGWYFKCQSDTQTLAVIPAIHRTGKKGTCSIQFITQENTWTVSFSDKEFCRRGKTIFVGRNWFSDRGIRLAVQTPKLSVKGKLDFGLLSPLKYDIMGPFALVPLLECRHMVWSMKHLVRGTVSINGQKYSFQDAYGYWEGDCGSSFPKEYIWTQCCFPKGALMLSVADIPLARFHFTGVICVISWKGKEYRLATYLGAKAVQISKKRIRIVQGKLELEVRLLEDLGRPLKAPAKGVMSRTIHESAACRAFYRFRKDGHTLFSFETKQASFEYEYKY